MKKRLRDSSGVLSIEASIALTAFMFFVMFLVDIGYVYRAQNYVTHGLIQTGKSMAAMSFQLEGTSNIGTVLQKIDWLIGKISNDNATDMQKLLDVWKGTYKIEDTSVEDNLVFMDSVEGMKRVVEVLYGTCSAGSDSEANAVLKTYGLENGTRSIDFTGTCLENDNKDLVIKAAYKVKLPFRVFGVKDVTLRQNVRSRFWKGWD